MKNLRPLGRILIVVLCLVAFGSTAVSAALPAANLPYAMQVTGAENGSLNVRAAADTNAQLIATLAEGTVLYPTLRSGNWYQFAFASGETGYVYGDYLSVATVKASASSFPAATLRTGPGTEYASAGLAHVNTELTVSGITGEWLLVQAYNGKEGYVRVASVKLPEKTLPTYGGVTPEDPEDPKPSGRSATTAYSSNVRKGPGTDYERVVTVDKGTSVTILSEKTGADGDVWYQVRLSDGTEGYIRSDLVVLGSSSGGLKGKLIVIDAGHGSFKDYNATQLDSGAVGPNNIKEKDINLAIAKYLQTELKNAGATVIMTRETELNSVLTLTQRAEVANKAGADAFISVHCNSFSDRSANGTETYYHAITANEAAGETLTSAQEALNANRKALATAVQKQLIAATGLSNRGVKTANFTVITKTQMPSILIETAFISNYDEEKLLSQAAFQQKVAAAVRQGFEDYFNN